MGVWEFKIARGLVKSEICAHFELCKQILPTKWFSENRLVGFFMIKSSWITRYVNFARGIIPIKSNLFDI